MKWSCLALLILMFLQPARAAWTADHEREVRQLSSQEGRFFEETFTSCQMRKKVTFDLTNQEKHVLLGTFGDANYTATGLFTNKQAAIVFEETRGLGMYLHELLHSYGFMLAVKKCFDGNEALEKMYVGQLLLIDAAIKGLVMGVTVIPTLGLVRFLSTSVWGRLALTAVTSVSLSGSSETVQEPDMIERMRQNMAVLRQEIESMRKSETFKKN